MLTLESYKSTTVNQKKYFDKRFLIVALAIGILLSSLYLTGSLINHKEINWTETFTNGFFSFIITISITYINIGIVNFLAERFPWQKGWAKRLTVELIVTSISAACIISIFISIVYFALNINPGYTFWYMIFVNSLVAIVINMILITILEGNELFQLYRSSILETETLKRQNIESQYAALINQINPHFLFNSLNVLSFLVSSNTEKAQEFISRFSWIYRYVLDVKDKSLVTLEQEIEFVNAYFFLQKLRYENKLDFKISIPGKKEDLFVPPLSLQILVENAIKHNEISFQHPMIIEIYMENDFLVVKNKIQMRKDKEPSTGYGLMHLKARYKHFTDKLPVFEPNSDYYFAKIPILSEE